MKTQGAKWIEGLAYLAVGGCLGAAGKLTHLGHTATVKLTEAGDPNTGTPPDMTYTTSDTIWQSVWIVIGSAAVAVLVSLFGARLLATTSRLASHVLPVVLATAGTALVAVSLTLPHAYTSRCGGGVCPDPPSEVGPIGIGAPFLAIGAALAVFVVFRRLRHNRLTGRRPGRPRDPVMPALSAVLFLAVGGLLLLGSVAIAKASSTDTHDIAGPAVPVGITGALTLAASLPLTRPERPRST